MPVRQHGCDAQLMQVLHNYNFNECQQAAQFASTVMLSSLKWHIQQVSDLKLMRIMILDISGVFHASQ